MIWILEKHFYENRGSFFAKLQILSDCFIKLFLLNCGSIHYFGNFIVLNGIKVLGKKNSTILVRYGYRDVLENKNYISHPYSRFLRYESIYLYISICLSEVETLDLDIVGMGYKCTYILKINTWSLYESYPCRPIPICE